MGQLGTRSGKHIFCAPCRKSVAAYNYAFKHGLTRPRAKWCKPCRRLRYHRYGEAAYQKQYKRRVRGSKAA